ncbi:MAG: hypothetical protein H7Y27_06435 [Gemmatimonadaceae bacterium]|nr:hypothetical protein [Chitinophagaceae bacterium]
MRIIQVIIFIFLSGCLCAQPNLPLGAGVIKIDIGKKPVLNFYSDSSQTLPVKTIEIVSNSNGDFVVKDEAANAWFKPEQLFLNYDLLVIRVESASGNWLKVFVDNYSGKMLWMRSSPDFRLSVWKKFLKEQVFSIQKRDGYDLDIRLKPSASATRFKKIEDEDCLQVMSFKDGWMQVKTNTELECSESRKPVKSGWIQWSVNNRLTIDYSMIY